MGTIIVAVESQKIESPETKHCFYCSCESAGFDYDKRPSCGECSHIVYNLDHVFLPDQKSNKK